MTAAADEPLFLRNDTHWSPKGAELAAQTLALQFPELRADTAYVTQAVSEKAVAGDLLNYLKTHEDLPRMPHGLHTVIPSDPARGLHAGVIFALRNIHDR